MIRMLAFLYGVAGYAAAMVVILYAIGFVGDVFVPKSIDTGAATPLGRALLVDVALLGLFAVQHSGMARRGFKRIWTRMVPEPIERSTYVWVSALVLAFVFWQWRPIPGVLWEVESAVGAGLLWVLFVLGWLLVVTSIELIDRWELFGVKQVHAFLRGRKPEPVPFKTPAVYKVVRHPLYLGFLLAFWATPVMTVGHLVFSLATTGYILIAVQLEERDLVDTFGEQYQRYRERVPMIVPVPGKSGDG